MHFSYGSSLLLLSPCLFSSISALPSPRDALLAERDASDCSKPAVKIVDDLLHQFPSFASKLCSTALHRTPAATVTVTATNTDTVPTTLTGQTTVTVTSGISTISTTTTTTAATTATVLTTTTTVPVVTITSAVTVAATVTNPGTTPATSTTTETVYTHVDKRKRAAPTSLSQLYPDCPEALGAIAIDLATTACDCFLGPVVTPTTTITATAISTTTINSISTVTVTVPSTTTTTTKTIVSSTTATTTLVTVLTSASSQIVQITATTTATVISTVATPIVTTTVTVSDSYQTVAAVPTGSRCVYNEYYSYVPANNDPTNNYNAGVEGCKTLCDSDSNCKFFLYYKSDPTYRNEGDNSAYCIIDNAPFNSQFLQCNVGFVLYDSAWNKV